MKSVKLIAMAVCLIQLTSFAQDELPEFEGEVTWSEFFDVSRRTSSPEIIGHDGEHVFLTRDIKNKTYIEKYNMRTLKPIKTVELELEYKGKDLILKGHTMFDGTPILYTSFYNKKTEITYAFIQKINKSTLAVSAPVPLSETKTPEVKGLMRNIGMSAASSRGDFAGALLISEDNQLGFITETKYADEQEKNEPLKVESLTGKLYDSELNLIAESVYELPYESFSIRRKILGNDGLVYMAGYQSEKEVDNSGLIKKEYTVYGDLEILVLDVESGDIEVLEISTDDREVKSFTYRVTNEGEVIVAGLSGKEDGGVSGGFYARYDAQLHEKSMNFVDFEEDFITQGWSERSKKKLEKKREKEEKKGEKKTAPTFYKYRIRDLIVKPDGTSTLLAEQYYVRVVTRTRTDANGVTTTTTTYYYYYNDIIALNFGSDGELAWKTVIDKYQVSVNDNGYYSSFFTVLEGNDINIIYNDRESNSVDTEGMKKSEIRALRRSTVGIRVLLNDEGGQSKEKLFEFEEGGLRLVPKVCSSSQDGVAFMYARAGRGDKIGLIQW